MKTKNILRKKSVIFLMVSLTVIICTYLRALLTLPGEITLLEGQESVYNFNSPFLVNVKVDKEGVIKVNNNEIKDKGNILQLSAPISLISQVNGQVNLNLKILGLIPLKTVKVDVVKNKKVVACGNTVGVKLMIDGILVIGISDVETIDGKLAFPIQNTDIKPGDLIIGVNGKNAKNINTLVDEINKSNGDNITLTYKRSSIVKDAVVKPVKSINDKKYHIGLWVRDNTAGIGTLTFFDPDTKNFGALGHGITDIDTGSLMPVETGEILESNILAVKKGKQGLPGELKGVFIEDKNKLGTIKQNNEYGIYGKLNEEAARKLQGRLYPIGLKSQIQEGPAKILANTNGKTVEEYEIEIQKVSKQRANGSKCMIIKITDEKLLNLTGGIVQGMSGSPIIQNERIIGAVTHVLVNDPTRGYGIFIEQMLKNVSLVSYDGIEKAS